MSESCNGNCSSCSSDCEDRTHESLAVPANSDSNIKKVIAIVSGKGGVGKSTVTSLLASSMAKMGKKVGILDADITGPSIPRAFGVSECREASEDGIVPAVSEGGISIMSINLLLDDESAPVLWRGPILAGAVKQFWTDVIWGELDYLFVDMPPGTGDVPLTVFQSLPIDGTIIVATPQELVSMIVAKAVNMANMMHVPVLGLVENYSYYQCPDCGKRVSIFGESKLEDLADQHGLPVLARLPIDPTVSGKMDAGKVEEVSVEFLAEAAAKIAAM